MATEVRLKLADLDDGEMRALDLGGEEVVVARVGGKCHAFGGICSHEGAPLVDGELDGEIVTCPWHFTEFDITTGKVKDGVTDEAIPTYSVAVDGDEVVVSKP